ARQVLQAGLPKGFGARGAGDWGPLAPPLLSFRHPAVHPAAEAHQDPMVPVTRQPVTLLVGDDDALVRECVAEIVGTLGFEAVLARSGEESLNILLRQTIDLSILDVNLGDMTGIEVFERYVRGPFIAAPRALQVPVPRRLPAIFMSSEPTPEVRSFC